MIMSRRTNGKGLLSKLKGVLLGTEHVGKPSEKAEPTRETARSSTTSDTIGLAVLIMFLLVLSQGTLIVSDNPNVNKKEE